MASASALTTSVRESVSGEEHVEPRISDEGAPPEPLTPARPGPGQALLRIQALALESGAPLAGIELALFPGDDEEEDREWLTSTQPDPARGVEGDDVRTGAEGRGEFVVECGRRYLLRGHGPDGHAGEAELELAPLAAGAEREVRLVLPTAWTLEWEGRIVEGESERPLTGVEVVVRVDAEDGNGVELARGRSQGDGRIRLRVPEWERMIVRCALPGYSPGGARLDREATSFDAPQSVVLRRPAGLAVHVRFPDGRPAEGLEVDVRTPSWFVIEGLRGEQSWSLTTDAEGRVEFGGLPSRADLFVSVRRGERTLAWTRMAERLQLEPLELRELEYSLPAGERLTVGVQDGHGAPLAGAALALWQGALAFDGPYWERFYLDRWVPADSFHLAGRRLAPLTTDERGHAELDGVSPGSYWLAAEAEDLPAVLWPFRIAAEEPSPGLELRLDRGLFVTGSVVDPDGRPVRAESLELRREEGTNVGSSRWTERDGSFVLGPLLAGTYRLRARGCDEPLFGPSEEQVVELVVAAGAEPITLAMTWGGRLRARALGVAGEELEGPAQGRLFQRGRLVTWLDDGEASGLVPGTYDLWLAPEGGLVGVQRGLHVRAQETLEVSVPVAPSATLVLPIAGAEQNYGRVTVEWEGLDIGWFFGRELLVPPGTLTVRFLEWGADFTERAVAERVRTLAAGESWVVSAP